MAKHTKCQKQKTLLESNRRNVLGVFTQLTITASMYFKNKKGKRNNKFTGDVGEVSKMKISKKFRKEPFTEFSSH